MRIMLAALILTLPLLAQDAPKPVAKKNKQVEIESLIKELEAQLGTTHNEAVKKVIVRLREYAKVTEHPGGIVVKGRVVEGGPVGIRLMVAPGGETMQGSFDLDGKKGTYTLKSGKDGKYTLDATIADGKGDTSQNVKDVGTFADLRAKYKWLQGGVIVATTPGNWGARDFWASAARIGRPVIGVQVRAPSEELRHHLEIPVGGGLVIQSVAPGSRADKLGLKKFDLLMRIDGELVEDATQVKKLAQKGVTLQYVRRANKKRLVTTE